MTQEVPILDFDKNRILFPDGTPVKQVKIEKCAKCLLGFICSGPTSSGGSVFASMDNDDIKEAEARRDAACLKENQKNPDLVRSDL